MVTHKQAEERVSSGFWIHVGSYVVVVSSLAVLNYQRNPEHPWVLWVGGGWGIGLAAHALAYFINRPKLVDRAEERMERREQRQEQRDSRETTSQLPETLSQTDPEF